MFSEALAWLNGVLEPDDLLFTDPGLQCSHNAKEMSNHRHPELFGVGCHLPRPDYKGPRGDAHRPPRTARPALSAV